VPLIIGDAAGVLGRLDLMAQIGVIACFDPEAIVTTIIVQGLDAGGSRTATVFGDDARAVGMSLAQLGHQPFGGMAFTIIFGRPIVPHNRFWHQGHPCTAVRMNNGGAQHLMTIGDRPIAVDFLQTRGAVNGLGGKILRAIER
jgi:hypothetical protein